jgi:hypothetical protein
VTKKELIDAVERIEQQLDYGQIDTALMIASSTLEKIRRKG